MSDSSKSFIANSQCVCEVSARNCRTCRYIWFYCRHCGHISWVHFLLLLLKTHPTGTKHVDNFYCQFAYPIFHSFSNSMSWDICSCLGREGYLSSYQYKNWFYFTICMIVKFDLISTSYHFLFERDGL